MVFYVMKYEMMNEIPAQKSNQKYNIFFMYFGLVNLFDSDLQFEHSSTNVTNTNDI